MTKNEINKMLSEDLPKLLEIQNRLQKIADGQLSTIDTSKFPKEKREEFEKHLKRINDLKNELNGLANNK